MVTFHNGNILDSGADVICHQVNCQGAMNSGVAKAIREKWPVVYKAYREKFQEMENKIIELCGSFESQMDVSEVLLGDAQVVGIGDKRYVVNLFAQQYYGYDKRQYTSYDAFWQCLNKLTEDFSKSKTIAFPARIGCVRGGANWNVILKMIEEVLGDYNVEIWDYDVG